MDGIKINNVSLFIGKIPTRKQECFYFVDKNGMWPAGYIRAEYLEKTKELWQEMFKFTTYNITAVVEEKNGDRNSGYSANSIEHTPPSCQ